MPRRAASEDPEKGNPMQTLYKQKRYIEPANGTIHIFPGSPNPEEYNVILWQQKDMKTAFALFNVYACSFEEATRIYNEKVIPEIARKERLYIASGKFDEQNN